jgi:hypothetical protein
MAVDMTKGELAASAVRAAGKGVKTGRTTSAIIGDGKTPNSASAQIDKLFAQYAPLSYKLPWEILDYVELLATYNPDYSQAVENIKMLANTGHELFVDAGSDLQRKRIKDYLEEKSRVIQEPHGGIDGIIEKLLDQAATFGAMCGEWVLSDDLTEVVDFVDLSPKKIRFFWVKEEQRYIPHQQVTGAQAQEAKKNGQEVRNNCVRLNETTFRYFAFDAAPESPYGTPPFLAALANIAIQRDMVHNMAQIVKKIGLLGMVDLTIEALKPKPGETDEAYAARAGKYLDDYVQVAEEMVRDGGMVHFDDLTVTMMQLGGNAAGATNIHKANEEMVMSGLKSMPSLQGRSYSTTETYAGIAYEITLRNTLKYQRAAKRMIESGYWLMATLGGFQPERIRLTFNDNRALNRVQEANAFRIEIANALMLWILGIFDQRDVAQTVGVDDPKTPMEEPPESVISIASAHGIFDPPDPDFQEQPERRATLEEDEDAEAERSQEAEEGEAAVPVQGGSQASRDGG